jgi:cytochrome c biogenesis protein CcmG/thiol:disulfide interchange protein DsbE
VKKNLVFFAVVILAISGLLFAGKKFSRRSAPGGALIGASINGRDAPDFDLRVLDGKGKNMKLSDLRGKAVLVNFWATWCGPCKIEMPWLVELQKKYGPDGFVILGVAMDEGDDQSISDFAKEMKVNYPVLRGTESVGQLYGGVEKLPTSFFVDRSGKVVDRQFGLVSESTLVDDIKKSLGGGATQSASGK